MSENSSNLYLYRKDVLSNRTDPQISLLNERAESTLPVTNEDIAALSKRIERLEYVFGLRLLIEGQRVCFVHISNKWKLIDSKYPCCEMNCVNTENPNVFCMNGNGFIQIRSDTNIEYVNCREERGENKLAVIRASNFFNKPIENSGLSHNQWCLNYTTFTLFYYEIKIQVQRQAALMVMGLRNENNFVALMAYCKVFSVFQYNEKFLTFPQFSIKNNDIIGCGLVYPPLKINTLPYIFFTHNGEKIYKAILLKENFEYYRPFLNFDCCSVETNFGDDLKSKPFLYDISKHYVAEEFYED